MAFADAARTSEGGAPGGGGEFEARSHDRPMRPSPTASIALGEYAENAKRKDFTPSELVTLMAEIEPILKELADERQRAGKKIAKGHLKGNAVDQPNLVS